MTEIRMIYVPLGGAGEIGMNMYVYGFGPRDREQIVLVDSGVMFPDMETTPGIDLIMPDFSWVLERRDRVEALFLTHAHEDHVGAVPYILEELDIPVFARPFTAELVRRKLEESGLNPGRVRSVKPTPEVVEAGPFSVQFIPVTHSVPESSSLLLEAQDVRVIHTGDVKLDQDPVIGPPFEPGLWSELARPGVDALVCDSTNVFVSRNGRPEGSVGPEVARLFAGTEGAIAATTFASNLARLKQLAEAAVTSGRSVVLLGRAMVRMVEIGRLTGVLDSFPGAISPEDARRLPRNRLLLLTTGSQGEQRSATSQLSQGKFRGLELVAGDTLLLSSKTIPGNERSVARVVNRFSARGIRVIDDGEELYHVSGHANRPDLSELYRLVDPGCIVPMHGEHRHLVEHARFAAECGFLSFTVPNGIVFNVSELRIEEEQASNGRLYLDGTELVEAESGITRTRLKMARMGLACVSIAFDRKPRVPRSIKVRLFGLPSDPELEDETEIARLVTADMRRNDNGRSVSDDDLRARVRKLVQKLVRERTGKSPEVGVMVHRL